MRNRKLADAGKKYNFEPWTVSKKKRQYTNKFQVFSPNDNGYLEFNPCAYCTFEAELKSYRMVGNVKIKTWFCSHCGKSYISAKELAEAEA